MRRMYQPSPLAWMLTESVSSMRVRHTSLLTLKHASKVSNSKFFFIIIRSFLKNQNSCLKRKVLRWQGCNLIIVFYSLFFLEAEDNVSFFTKFGGNLELIFKWYHFYGSTMIKRDKESVVQVIDLTPGFNEAASQPELNHNKIWHYHNIFVNFKKKLPNTTFYICHITKLQPLTHTFLPFLYGLTVRFCFCI